ncbi:MAG: M20/M25/M40 family metallo-hydrolase [Deltaproteobacteria bacterium]|nr:M20/M25/M40 family metallo-hydrolase [Deltaproteobacteria bacterium]
MTQYPLFSVSPVEIYSASLSAGDYAFYFLVYMNPNAIVDSPYYYDFVQVHVAPDPLVLARVEVPGKLQYLNLPVHAGLVDGSGVYYALVIATRTQLNAAGVTYRVIDECPPDTDYLLASSGNPDDYGEAAKVVNVLYDDGHWIIVRDIGTVDEILADIGFDLKLMSDEPITRVSTGVDAAQMEATPAKLPSVSEMIGKVKQEAVNTYISQLSGESQVTVEGEPYTIKNRHTDSGTPIQKATQYILDKLKGMKGMTVSTHDWTGKERKESNIIHKGSNIIGELKGKEKSSEIIIMIAHLDSINKFDESYEGGKAAPGADDNASGCAALLAAAEIMSNYSFQSTIRFIFTTGEEQGTRGSMAYVKEVKGQNIVAVLNLDMIAYSTSGLTPPTQHVKTRHIDDLGNLKDMIIANLYKDVVTLYGLDSSLNVVIKQDSDVNGDQSSFWDKTVFLDKTIPAVWVIEDDYSNFNKDNMHTVDDRLKTLNMPYCTAQVKATLATVAHLAGSTSASGPYPLNVMSSQEL